MFMGQQFGQIPCATTTLGTKSVLRRDLAFGRRAYYTLGRLPYYWQLYLSRSRVLITLAQLACQTAQRSPVLQNLILLKSKLLHLTPAYDLLTDNGRNSDTVIGSPLAHISGRRLYCQFEDHESVVPEWISQSLC